MRLPLPAAQSVPEGPIADRWHLRARALSSICLQNSAQPCRTEQNRAKSGVTFFAILGIFVATLWQHAPSFNSANDSFRSRQVQLKQQACGTGARWNGRA